MITRGAACVNGGVVSYYDPATAQFLTPDPLFAVTGSRYGYAGNDPINGSDPTGLWPWDGKCVKGITCPEGPPNLIQDWGADHPEAAQSIVNVAGGALKANPITAFLPLDLAGHGVNKCSAGYKAGFWGMVATDLLVGGAATRELFSREGLNLAGGDFAKAALHDDPHPFGSLGNKPHFQLNWWTAGAKGSGGVVRVPRRIQSVIATA